MAQLKKVSKEEVKEESGRKPDYNVRCRQAPGSDYFINAGAAWVVKVNGKDALSVKLTALPVQFDGSLLLLQPLED